MKKVFIILVSFTGFVTCAVLAYLSALNGMPIMACFFSGGMLLCLPRLSIGGKKP